LDHYNRNYYICCTNNRHMKPYLFLLLLLYVLLTSCNNNEKTATTISADGSITETPLPRGKLIVDDAIVNTAIPQDPSTFNGVKGQDSVSVTNASKEESEEIRLKRRYKNLLVFHADDTMKINKAYIATLIMSKDQVYGNIKDEVLTSSNADNQNVKMDSTVDIGTKMRARLIDMSGATNKGFEIELIGGNEVSEQRINDKHKKAVWNWKLTPLTPGQQNLKLAITVIEKDDQLVTLPTKDIEVIIFAESESIMSKATAFMEKNYQWLLATLLIPLFMGWFNARMRHRFDKKIIAERDRSGFTPNVNVPATPLQPQNTQAPEVPKETGSNNNGSNKAVN
jgi:hypothetical protein